MSKSKRVDHLRRVLSTQFFRPARITLPRRALSLCVVAAVGVTSPSLNAQSSTPASQSSDNVKIIKSRILVRPKAGLNNTELDKILSQHGGRSVRHMRQLNVHIVELPAQASEMGVLKALRSNPHIKFAEPDVVADPALFVNDPYFNGQWHLPKITAPAAWDMRTGAGVTIAILDSGVDASHPDLAGQLVPGWNTFDNNDNTADVAGHGTLVAGTAGAAGNNSVGVTGVSFGAKIMPIRVTDTAGYGYYSTLADGIVWAADNGARVVNMSFLGTSASSTILSAAQYMRSKGGVVVASAGNTGILESYAPTDYMTLVSATDANNNLTSFSSYGAYVDLAAPGTGIQTTVRGGSYASAAGTSFSSPIVAGVYALMISANPSLGAAQLDNAMFSTALDLFTAGKDDKAGWGLVNANAAVSKAIQATASDSTPPVVSIGSPTGGTKLNGLASVSVTATDNISIARTELYLNGTLHATENVAPYAFTLDTTKLPDGNATLIAKAFDTAGNAGTSASVVVTIANDTIAPVVTLQNPVSGSTVSGTVNVSATATDNQKVASMRLSIDGREVALSYGPSLTYAWNAGSTTKRGKRTATIAHTLTIVASDPAGNNATKSITVNTQ